ncbi:hypothetical protein FXF50_21650 [Micromonospora sp. AP08]|uniref:hypothetical protein n=1 Tax=Micromonospora sp. AP08 TaxID=2604467 RepID=UPI0011D7041F|nr:hypothetical protein [Micromonospora sp. AP08]TYB35933.1 hypothetical protein FXF50_21650 [Micromonospora sp. AP08]
MTPDPTTPLPAEPPPPAAYDPWSAMPPAAAPFPAPPAPPAQFSAPPATAQFSAPPATAQFSAPPATAPFSAPPATAPFSAPPATAPFSAPPGQFAVPPGAPVGMPAPHGGALVPAAPYPPVPAPLPGPLPPAQSVVAVQIGEIMVTPPVIRTPAGVLPLAGSSWHVVDHWQKEEKVATWAVVAAILGFFCLTVFSLLFLLVKETRHHGTVQVTVTNGGHQYVARIPVSDQFQVQQINNQVNYARSLSTG